MIGQINSFVLVVGCQRSGTTLTGQILGAHERTIRSMNLTAFILGSRQFRKTQRIVTQKPRASIEILMRGS